MDINASAILIHDQFKTLSEDSLCGLLERDSFFTTENLIFMGVNRWCDHNPDINPEQVVSRVRLPLMNLDQLLLLVRPSGILESDRILDAIEEQTVCKYLPYRGQLWPEENVATAQFRSQTITGEFRTTLLNGDTTSYDMEKGYTRHSMCDNRTQNIIVELGMNSIINHIKLLLWDRDARSYSYYIEVSVNKVHWERVIDHEEYYCRSWQYLYFPSKVMRYIKIVGTHNTVNKVR